MFFEEVPEPVVTLGDLLTAIKAIKIIIAPGPGNVSDSRRDVNNYKDIGWLFM